MHARTQSKPDAYIYMHACMLSHRDSIRLRGNGCRQDLHHVGPRAGHSGRPWTQRSTSRTHARSIGRLEGRSRNGGPHTEVYALPLRADLGAALRRHDANTGLLLRNLQRGCVRPAHSRRPPPSSGKCCTAKTRAALHHVCFKFQVSVAPSRRGARAMALLWLCLLASRLTGRFFLEFRVSAAVYPTSKYRDIVLTACVRSTSFIE